MENTLDQNGNDCAIFMDLSKAFGTINHDVLITKLGAYGFDTESLKLIRSYLTNLLQRTREKTSFSWTKFFWNYLKCLHWDHFYLIFKLKIYLMEMTALRNNADNITFHVFVD